MLKLWLIKVDRFIIPCFWRVENELYVVACVDSNLKWFKECVQHEKWTLGYVDKFLEFSDLWRKCKVEFLC